MNEKTQNSGIVSGTVNTYRVNTHCPCAEEFVCGGNYHRKVGATDFKYLYSVTPPSGTTYYEVVERGHLYKPAEGTFLSSCLSEGDEMYPNNEDFGRFAWCFNSKEMAVNSLRWDRKNHRRLPLGECHFADGFKPTI